MLIAPEGLSATTGGIAVGRPKAEAVLTNSLLRATQQLLRPGRGRELFVLPEVELGVGRPDVLLMAISRNAVEARRKKQLRLRTLTEAEILASWLEGRESRHSEGHVRATLARARLSGWIRESGHLSAGVGLVADSVLIEAKISDWRTGINQLARARFGAHRAVLVMPEGSTHRPPRPSLEKNRIGLLTVRPDGSVGWVRRSKPSRLSTAADLWLVELAIRALERAIR